MEHTTSLEHALDEAKRNFKEAKRLLDKAVAAHEAGDIDAARLASLQRLYDAAAEDVVRTTREV